MNLNRSFGSFVSFIILWGLLAAVRPAAQSDPTPGLAGFDPTLFGGLKYRSIGPSRGGRVTAVAGVASEPGTFYMGATGGGVWKTADFGQSWANVTLDGGLTWSTQNNQPTAELYQVAVDDQFPYWVYAGQQDSSTITVPSLPPYAPALGPTAFWRAVGGCETGPAVPKPGNPDIVYANCKGCFGRYNKATGQEQLYWVGAANMYGHNPKDLAYRSRPDGQGGRSGLGPQLTCSQRVSRVLK
jgi:hypothetical protein